MRGRDVDADGERMHHLLEAIHLPHPVHCSKLPRAACECAKCVLCVCELCVHGLDFMTRKRNHSE